MKEKKPEKKTAAEAKPKKQQTLEVEELDSAALGNMSGGNAQCSC